MHAILNCNEAADTWGLTEARIDRTWFEHGLDWSGRYSWMRHPPTDWCTEWGVWGLVPREMLSRMQEARMHRFTAQKLLSDTARTILDTAKRAWELRNDQVLKWEKEQPGLANRKLEAQRRQWKGKNSLPKLPSQAVSTEIQHVHEQAPNRGSV